MLRVNEILHVVEKEIYYRILYFNILTNTVTVIQMYVDKGMPMALKLDAVMEEIGQLNIVVQTEIKEDLSNLEGDRRTELEIKNGMKVREEQRDRRWNIIQELVDGPFYVHYPKITGKRIAEVADKHQIHRNKVYKYLRAYWQNGMCKNALLPQYSKCGGRGKRKDASGKKRGRKGKNAVAFNVDDKIAKKLQKGYHIFYMKISNNTLMEAYRQTLRNYFNSGYKINVQGNKEPIIDHDHTPSFQQFKYWGELKYSPENVKRSRVGKDKFNLNHKEVTGSSVDVALFPGNIYQIDGALGQIDLVKPTDDKEIIGRPYIYLMYDQFSRAIPTFHVGLNAFSWQDAAMAIYNCTRDIVELCAEYGVKTTKEEWPDRGLPNIILADNSEMAGKQPDSLIEELGISVRLCETRAAYLKGGVESIIKQIKSGQMKNLPAARKKAYERQSENTKKNAAITIRDYTAQVIYKIIELNKRVLSEYPLEYEAVKDKVEPIPLEIWKWGMINKGGVLYNYPDDTLKFALMYKDVRALTYKGIKFKNAQYVCAELKEEGVLARLRNTHSKNVTIHYDPRKMEYLYIKLGGKIYRFYTRDTVAKTLYSEEIDEIIEDGKVASTRRRRHNLDNWNTSTTNIEALSEKSIEQLSMSSLKNSERQKNIPINREAETQAIGAKEAFVINTQTKDINDESKEKDIRLEIENDEDEFEYISNPDYSELFE